MTALNGIIEYHRTTNHHHFERILSSFGHQQSYTQDLGAFIIQYNIVQYWLLCCVSAFSSSFSFSIQEHKRGKQTAEKYSLGKSFIVDSVNEWFDKIKFISHLSFYACLKYQHEWPNTTLYSLEHQGLWTWISIWITFFTFCSPPSNQEGVVCSSD